MAKFRIKAAAAARGMTIGSLAQKMGVTPQYLGSVAAGKGNPAVSVLEEIASALGVATASLFEDYLESTHEAAICPRCGARFDIKTGKGI